MPRLDFVDISHWQSDAGVIDWGKVRDAGVLGAIIKATEGTSYKDPDFTANRSQANAAGLKVATYHFLKHGSIEAQMRHYVQNTWPIPGERVVIDYEDAACDYGDLRTAVSWLKQLVPHAEISVYGSAKLTDDVRAAGAQAATDMAGTSCWMARYSSSAPAFAANAWPAYSAWQYTQTGKVPGITGNVDLNEFNGSREACMQWIGPPTAAPEPAPPPAQREAVAALTYPPGTDVTISVNDAIVWQGTAP